MQLSTRSAAANTATIRPPAGRLPNSRPRSASNSAPSSRPNTPGDAGRRILADAVAQHHIRFDAPRLPQPGQAHLHREQGGLGVRGVPQDVVLVGCRKSLPALAFQARRSTAAAHRVTVSPNTGSVSNNSRAIPANWLP